MVASAAAATAIAPIEEDAPRDDEVLRELGAFDPTEEDAEPDASAAKPAPGAAAEESTSPTGQIGQQKRA